MYSLLPEEAARELVSGAHGAVADCLMVAHLLEWIQGKAGDWDLKTPEGLWQFSEECRTPTHMPFGKHKGELLSEMPKDYVGWALRTCEDMDPYLRKALEKL
jgi:exodeoxyribonuclease X